MHKDDALLPSLPPPPSLCCTAATTKLPPPRRLRQAAKTAHRQAVAIMLPPSLCCTATTPPLPQPPPCSCHHSAAKLSPSRRPSLPTPSRRHRPCRPRPLRRCPHPLFAGWLSRRRLHLSSSPASLSAVVLLATASSSSFSFAGWLLRRCLHFSSSLAPCPLPFSSLPPPPPLSRRRRRRRRRGRGGGLFDGIDEGCWRGRAIVAPASPQAQFVVV